MSSGGYQRQRVYGTPESRPQGGVGRAECDTGRWDSGLSRWPPLHPRPACPAPIPVGAEMAKKREQMVGTLCSVPCPSQAGQEMAGGAGVSRGPEETPPGSIPASSALTAASLCPKAGEAVPEGS